MRRGVDVDALVHSLSADGARVVAGRAGTTRTVTGARSASAPDELGRLAAGELIVATASVLGSGGTDWHGVVADLDAVGIAGLVLRLDPGSDDLPTDLLAAAELRSLPILVVPASTVATELTARLLERLLDGERRRLDDLLAVHERFTRIVLAGGGPSEIGAALHDVLGCTVWIEDPDGVPLAVVPSDATTHAPPDGPDGDGGGDGGDGGRPGDGDHVVRQPIRAGDQDYGAVVALTGGRPLTEDAAMALERAAMAMAMRQAQATAVAEAEERFAGISLEELVSRHVADVASIAERSASFGWDLSRPRAVLLASVDPPTDPAVLSDALRTIAAAARATLPRDAIVWRRSATIAALIAPGSDAPADRRRIAEALRAELDRRVRSVTVSIGVGRRVVDPADLSRSFTEASRAVDVGRWAKGRHVTELFDELGLERLLAATPPDDLSDFVHHAIGPLLEHDRQHGGELLDTLATWLQTRNMAEAARRMSVHVNTMKNRLERIESILGPVLSDPERALECEVAIHVSRHHDVVRPTEG